MKTTEPVETLLERKPLPELADLLPDLGLEVLIRWNTTDRDNRPTDEDIRSERFPFTPDGWERAQAFLEETVRSHLRAEHDCYYGAIRLVTCGEPLAFLDGQDIIRTREQAIADRVAARNAEIEAAMPGMRVVGHTPPHKARGPY